MNITLTLTPEQINILMAGLGKLPLEVGLAVWMEVKKQAEAQMQSASTATSE